jgi:hypothetical protein
LHGGEGGNTVLDVANAMIRRRTFRQERTRAAAALLAYLGDPCAETERSLLDATHDLEAAAALRRLQTVSQRGHAVRLRQLAAR